MANDLEGPCEATPLTLGAAFVVHLAVVGDADGATSAAPDRGRVEHVLSGAATDFHSIADLVTFMGETLARSPSREQSGNPANAKGSGSASPTVDSS